MPTKEELDEMSGFGRPTITQFPSIKFSATDRGKAPIKSFSLLSQNAKGELVAVDLGEEIKGVILNRGKMRLKSSDFTSTEYERNTEVVSIFDKEKSFKEATGVAKDIKENYKMNPHQYPYILIDVNGDSIIAKLDVLPASLKNYFEYQKEFTKDERPYQFETIIKAEKEISKNKGNFYKISFSKGGEYKDEALDFVYDELEKLSEKLKANDKARESTNPILSAVVDTKDIEIPVYEDEEPLIEDEEIDPRQNEAGL